MNIRLVILVLLVFALTGVLYWKGDRSYREQALYEGVTNQRAQELTVEDIVTERPVGQEPSPEPADEITATQVPEDEQETGVTAESPNTTAETPEPATAPAERNAAVTAPVETESIAVEQPKSAEEQAIEVLPFAWLSPAQESQPGFVAPDRTDARVPGQGVIPKGDRP